MTQNQNLPPLQPLRNAIRTIPNFPKPGIQYKDITPLTANPQLFQHAIQHITHPYKPGDIHQTIGIDARGFIFAAAAAHHLQTGFTPIRKKGKLPFHTHQQNYDLEYGTNTIAIHTDATKPGAKILLIDDLLATGGTAAAAIQLLNKLNTQIIETIFLIELTHLNGKQKLTHTKTRSILTY